MVSTNHLPTLGQVTMEALLLHTKVNTHLLEVHLVLLLCVDLLVI